MQKHYILIDNNRSRNFNILELLNKECVQDKIKVPFLIINISLLIILINFFCNNSISYILLKYTFPHNYNTYIDSNILHNNKICFFRIY